MSVVALGDNFLVTTLRRAGVNGRKAHDVHEAEQIIEEDLEEVYVTKHIRDLIRERRE